MITTPAQKMSGRECNENKSVVTKSANVEESEKREAKCNEAQ